MVGPVAHGSEADRLEAARNGVAWKKWGPYLSERQWGTVREDYSDNGDAWSYFTHDQARSRAYKWGEDGIAGFCDDHQRLCFAIAAVERRRPDPQGADVRPDERRGQPRRGREGVLLLPRRHADELVPEVPVPLSARRVSRTTTSSTTNRSRGRIELEYELLDTGVFDDDRYVDVDVEYAKAAPEDIHVRITRAPTAAPSAATVHLLPTLWFRNTWWMGAAEGRPLRRRAAPGTIVAEHPELGSSWSCGARATPTLLFTENETNTERLWGSPNPTPYVKDAFHEYVVHGEHRRGQPGSHRHEGGGALRAGRPGRRLRRVVHLRLCRAGAAPRSTRTPIDALFATRIAEADEFYALDHPAGHARPTRRP